MSGVRSKALAAFLVSALIQAAFLFGSMRGGVSPSETAGDIALPFTINGSHGQAESSHASSVYGTNGDTNRTTSATKNDEETFSACIMILDDNHRLAEWVAYHYHAMPLRYLVVSVDPRSRTSPSSILGRFRRLLGMTILEWSDREVFGPKEGGDEVVEEWDKLSDEQKKWNHRKRQTTFMAQCLKHMKAANRTWVLMIDSDEYLLVNRRHRLSPPPSVLANATVLQVLRSEVRRPGTEYSKSCLTVPRTIFGTREDLVPPNTTKDGVPLVPPSFNGTLFDTIRWRKHSRRRAGFGKTMIDVSRIDRADLPNKGLNAHRPIPKLCDKPAVELGKSLFQINHYLGSWEAYSYRDNDARWGTRLKGKENYDSKAAVEEETDDDIRPWLSGFVQQHGPEEASTLLKDVGILEPHKAPLTVNNHMNA